MSVHEWCDGVIYTSCLARDKICNRVHSKVAPATTYLYVVQEGLPYSEEYRHVVFQARLQE